MSKGLNKKLLLVVIAILVIVIGANEIIRFNKRVSLRTEIKQAVVVKDAKVTFGLVSELKSQKSMFSFMNSSADYGKKEMCAILENNFGSCLDGATTEKDMKVCDGLFDKWLQAGCDTLEMAE